MARILTRFRGVRATIARVSACGHLPPAASPRAYRVLRAVARAVTWVQVGPIRVVGDEHLRSAAPKLVIANHSHYADAAIFALLLPEPPRFMAARGVFRFAGGIGALIASRWGAFCVDLDPCRGAPARAAAVEVLARGETLVLFPEGWTNVDGMMGAFKNGAARIVQQAARAARRPFAIVPVYLRYGRYPGRWITRLACPLQYLLLLLGVPRFRRGVTVTVGAALRAEQLPEHPQRATAALHRLVRELDAAARAAAQVPA